MFLVFKASLLCFRSIHSDNLTEKTLSLLRGGFLVDTHICQFEPACRQTGDFRQKIVSRTMYAPQNKFYSFRS